MKPQTFTTEDGTVITYDGNVTVTKPSGDWEPKDGDIVYTLGGDGDFVRETWTNACYQQNYLAMGNVFPTLELAQKKKDYLLTLNKVTKAIKKKNNGWVPDWSDENRKYFVDYLHDCHEWIIEKYANAQTILPFPHCKTREIAQEIIDEYQAELEVIKFYTF